MIESTPSVLFQISVQLFDGAADRHVKANIKNSIGAVIQTQNLINRADGLYSIQTTLAMLGSYTVQCVIYKDNAYAVEDLKYDRPMDDILIKPEALSAAEVWNYETRGLTEPVSVSNQIGIANIGMTTGVITTTKTQEIMAWLELDSMVIMNPTSCSIQIIDKDGGLKHDFGLNTSPFPNGFFTYTKPNANTVLAKGESYMAVITIVHNSKTYSAMRGITVLS